MSKILITETTGYIGSMLCTKLLEARNILTAVDTIKYDKNFLSHLFYFDKFEFFNS
tara:strand:- start:285 stop:452 length:168 start_codon:yes stop_codon:yes gene_type:complete